MNKPNKNQPVDIENKVVVTREEGAGRRGGGEMDKGDQLYGDRWKLNFW